MTDPTPLEDALRNLGDELSAAGRPTVTAGQFIARHLHTPAADTDLVEAAVDHGLAARHGRDNPYHNATVRLMCRDQLIVGIVNRAAAEGNRRAEQWRLEAERLRRMNVAAMSMLGRIDVPPGNGTLRVEINNVKLALGSSLTNSGGADRIDAQWAAISQQAAGHPEETP